MTLNRALETYQNDMTDMEKLCFLYAIGCIVEGKNYSLNDIESKNNDAAETIVNYAKDRENTMKNYRNYSCKIVTVEPVEERFIDILVTNKDDAVPTISILTEDPDEAVDIPINRAHQIAKILNALGDAFNADGGKDVD